MLQTRSYSVAELQDLSGFDRRTIVYYIQQGLIARPGRRGPNTRYPQEALARLQFIRGVKDLQTRGQLLNVTLLEIRRVLETIGPEKAQVLVSRSMPPDEISPLFTEPAPPERPRPEAARPEAVDSEEPLLARIAREQKPVERRAFGLADANVRRRFMTGQPPQTAQMEPREAPAPANWAGDAAAPRNEMLQADASATPAEPMDLATLGNLLRELEIRPSMSGKRLPPGASEQWTEIPITSRVFLSVRGLSADDAPLADAVARAMKKLLRIR